MESALTALVSGIPGVEMMGGAISAMTGGTYQGGRQSIAARQARAKESISPIAYGAIGMIPEIAGMALAPVTAAPRLLGTMGGRALMSGGIEAVRGASRAGIQNEQAPTLSETAMGAAKGGAFGFAGSLAGEGLVRGGLGVAKGLGRFAGLVNDAPVPGRGVIPTMQQGAANMLRSPFAQRVAPNASRAAAEIIEPIGPARASRVLREELPAPQSTLDFRDAANVATNRANTATRAQAEQVRTTAQEAANQLSAQGRTRIQAVRGTLNAARQQAEQTRQAMVERVRQNVADATERLKALVPPEVPTNVDELRTSIRATQKAAGDVSYNRAFELADGVDFSPIGRQAEAIVSRNPEVAAAYKDAFVRGGGQEAGPDVLPTLDLPTFDRMRANINDRVESFLRGDATGIPRARAREALRDIGLLEDAYVNRIREVRGDAAATSLKEARAEYGEYFRQLDALRDGRNLGRFGFGKKEGNIAPNKMNIQRLEESLQQVSPEARQSFQVGAREWVNDVIRRTPEDARKVAANLVGTEERFRRTALAMGPEAANDLRVVFRDVKDVKDAAKRGLQVAREAQRGVVSQARTTAQLEADRIASEVAAGRRQIAKDRNTFLRRITQNSPERADALGARELSRQMGQARQAVGNADVALGFANTILPKLSGDARVSASRVMALRIDDEVMGLMTQAGGAEKVAQRFAELRQNPATNALLGNALNEAERRLRAGVPLRRPVGAVLGSNLAASLNRE